MKRWDSSLAAASCCSRQQDYRLFILYLQLSRGVNNMNIFTKDEEQKIIEMYKNKVSIDDIINHFNSNERYIRIVLKNNAVDRVYNTFSDELCNRIIYLFNPIRNFSCTFSDCSCTLLPLLSPIIKCGNTF